MEMAIMMVMALGMIMKMTTYIGIVFTKLQLLFDHDFVRIGHD